MTQRRVDVFFYGLFMDASLLRAKGVDPQDIGVASAPGCALRIGQRATLVRDPNSRAYGVLMRLTHDEIERLYSEPSVQAYKPEAVMLELNDGAQRAALCFNLVNAPGPEERNAEYAAKLRALASRLGLPQNYIDRIQ